MTGEGRIMTREYIIQVLKELDAESKKPIGRKALKRKGINLYWIEKLIPEGLTRLKQNLGLKIAPQEMPLSDDELLEKIDKIVSDLECMPTWAKLRRETGITDKVFNQRFGKQGIFGVFSHYREWLKNQKPNSKNIKLVDLYFEKQGKTKAIILQPVKCNVGTIMPKWQRVSGRNYGATLYFRNLIYTPTNEQGVVFLFAMVSEELGFSIESIGQEFPDCVAKRYIEGKRDQQQHVRIEFEYESRDFDHPTEGCDIIVCWKNNWKNCPLEVIELSTKIKDLQNAKV